MSIDIEGIRVLSLTSLIKLKLASGMTNEHRGQDLIDVQRVIDTLDLPEEFAAQLHPYVQEKFKDLWGIVQRKRARESES